MGKLILTILCFLFLVVSNATAGCVKGNCVNEENPDDYAFGYFRLTEVVKTSYTFE